MVKNIKKHEPETVAEALERYERENQLGYIILDGMQTIALWMVISCALLWGMGQLLIRNHETITRVGDWIVRTF